LKQRDLEPKYSNIASRDGKIYDKNTQQSMMNESVQDEEKAAFI